MSNKDYSFPLGFSNAFIAPISSEIINMNVNTAASSHSFAVKPAPLNANWFRNERLGLNLWSFTFNISAYRSFTSGYSVVNIINSTVYG